MAFDNPPWPKPPDGAEYINAAANMARTLSNMVGGLGDAYQSGQKFRYEQRQRDLFQGDDTTLQDALRSGDYSKLLQKMIQAGGAPALGNVGSLIDLQNQTGFYNALRGLQGGQGGGGTNTGPAASVAAASPESLTPGPQSQPQPSGAAGQSVQSLAVGIAGGRDIPDRTFQSAVTNAARTLGVDPEKTTLSPGQEQRARRLLAGNLGAADLPMGSASTGGISSPAVTQPSPVPQAGLSGQDESSTGQLTPRSSMGGMGPISPAPTSASGNIAGTPGQSFDSRFSAAYGGGQAGARPTPLGTARDADALDARARQYYEIAAAPRIRPEQAKAAEKIGDQLSQQARTIREQLGTFNAPATNPEIQGQLHRFEGADKAVGEQIGSYVKAMPDARRMIQNLDVIEDAVRHAGNNLTVGPGHEAILKMKQFLSNYAKEPVQGLSEAEVISKMNIYLASENAHQLTPRPAWAEVQNFMRANPGLMNSTRGTVILADVLRQGAQQTVDLGRLGMDRRNWDNWSAVEDRYFQQHGIRLPFSGNPAGGQAQGQTAPGRYRWSPDSGLQALQP